MDVDTQIVCVPDVQPCERSVIDHALMLCDGRAAAFDPRRSVLVHGDAHGWNTLAAGDGTYKFVDAEGLCSEPEHDLAVAMREYNDPLLKGDTPATGARSSRVPRRSVRRGPQIVSEWGFIDRVSTGPASMRDFDTDEGVKFLEVAQRCL